MKKVMVTCYDATFAKLCADAQVVDFLLVGDSLGMVIQGASNTLSVSLQDMVYHTRAVRAGLQASSVTQQPLIVSDLPVGTYESPEESLRSSLALVEAGADIVKLEGPKVDCIQKLRSSGLRVCGHIGLTPQTIQNYKVQGRSPEEAERLRREARAIADAGAEMIVFEMIPALLAQEMTNALSIPTIGIGAGPHCSGQVLVLYDLLGLNPEFNPKFLKTFWNGAGDVSRALKDYAREVREVRYPDEGHSF